MGGGYEIGLSASASSGANAGSGEFMVYGGSTKSNQTAIIAAAVVGGLALIAFFVLNR